MQSVLTTARSLLIGPGSHAISAHHSALAASLASPSPQGAIIERQRIQTELEKVFAQDPWGKEVLPLVGPLAMRSLQEIKGGKRPVAMSASSGTADDL